MFRAYQTSFMKLNSICRLAVFVLIAVLYSCKTKQHFQSVHIEVVEQPVADTTIVTVLDTLPVEDDWVEMPVKSGRFQGELLDQINNSGPLKHGFSGFLLHDPEADTVIFNLNEHKYFVAASNTKIFTLYACLKTMKDSLAALKYVETDSTLTIWGTADPTLLHPDFTDAGVIEFLKRKVARRHVNLANYDVIPPYGKGWMWDDYNDAYQAEITAMPLFGNVLTVKQEKNSMTIVPTSPMLNIDFQSEVSYVRRVPDQNLFELPSNFAGNAYFKQKVPYKYAERVNKSLLGDIIGARMDTVKLSLPIVHQTKYSLPKDTVLRRMMYKSDNMLAEHLLLNASMQAIETLHTATFIKWMKDTYLADLPQRIYWVDGSGLSRYNQCTPTSLVYILNKLYKEEKRERLFSFFNEVKANQLSEKSKPVTKPMILGKSGTMSGVYNLSGYIVTKSGHSLVYSFMNNNFDTPVRDVRQAITKILNYIAEHY